MARKKNTASSVHKNDPKAYIEHAGEVVDQKITDTLEKNYMPYAMSVIVSRAIPEIDGFKPSHRKLLYTMYKMGLLTGARTKSANVVGSTMKLNPHGDMAIYETMVRLARGNEALLHPYVDSKGNFGKAYSRDMAFAASRYTEVKLDPICQELFRDIDKDTVDFVDNYDNKLKEPTLLPVTFPTILVNANTGIAVGMASSICPFNLEEVCNTTIELIKNPNHDLSLTLTAPDFPGGGQIIYNPAEMDKIYRTGRGSFKVRARWNYDKSCNCIEITQIPPTTTTEAIIDKVVDLIKSNKLREISDMRDETDLSGLKLAIDLKRGVDPDLLMQKLYRFTPLEDSFSCNFNVLIGGTPRVLGDFVPAKLGMDEGESAIAMAVTADYQGYMLFCFENGKVAKVNLNAYETKTNRKKLLKAYSTREKLTAALCLHEDGQILLTASNGRLLLLPTALLPAKATKDQQGLQVMKLTKGSVVSAAEIYQPDTLEGEHRYLAKALPSRGEFLKDNLPG